MPPLLCHLVRVCLFEVSVLVLVLHLSLHLSLQLHLSLILFAVGLQGFALDNLEFFVFS